MNFHGMKFLAIYSLDIFNATLTAISWKGLKIIMDSSTAAGTICCLTMLKRSNNDMADDESCDFYGKEARALGLRVQLTL